MEPTPRYEILNTIATGDFATVFRARDRELGREVAIKQIHQQFLNDPRQLERYWREAQLLATLQHPNILTIYDLVRPRGWLILELMRGNLQQSVQAGPLDLDLLRLVLVCGLNALGFLHSNGVIHGDVKPSNMLVDLQGRVKLGDFGLARRASNEQGSLLKGTTKYMAPELVSNQFGPVGPASDLYSLGFSAYEMMCGPQFDSLFPSLSTFGRDRQIAWLMWHAAPDRQMPEVGRVLEGVPPDLARVIERLVAKDQARRYHSAQEVLRDLRAGQLAPARAADADAAADAAAAKKKRMMRIGAITAVVFSMLLSLLMLLPSRPKKAAEPKEHEPLVGTVRSIYKSESSIAIEVRPDGHREQPAFKPSDKFYINKKEAGFFDLKVGDDVEIEVHRDEQGRKVAIVHATRPETQQGRIKAVEPDSGRLTLTYDTEKGPADQVIRVPATVKILFNGKEKLGADPVKLADLKSGDRVDKVSHLAEEGGRYATALEVQREETLKGIIRGVDVKKGELTVADGEAPDAKLVTMPLAPKCTVTVNDRTVLDQRVLTPADLKPGDKATVTHDRQVVRVDAYRTLGQAGVIQAVQPKSLVVAIDGETKPTTFTVDATTKITLGGETVPPGDLLPGDTVDITHDSPNAATPRALTVAARRAADLSRWAVLIGIQDYDDASLGRLEFPVADATVLHEMLVKRDRVPPNQALLLTNESQVRLRQGISNFLDRIQPDQRLLVYFVGHAYQDADKTVYLAPKDFKKDQAAATGLSLQWLVDAMEECKAKEKILLLDACHAGPGVDVQKEPSTAEMFESLKAPPGQAALRTVTGIASCTKGQRGYDLPARQHGLFALALSEGFAGKADKNRDNRVEPTELYSYLADSMASLAGSIQQRQTPQVFLPDNRPPRLSAEAKKAIRALARLVSQSKIDSAVAQNLYDAAQAAAGQEIEPKLLFGLVRLKSGQKDEAMKHFEGLKAEHPRLLLPSEALAWLRFERGPVSAGVDELGDVLEKIPKPGIPPGPNASESRALFLWIGQLREFAGTVDERRSAPAQALSKLDAAVAAHGEAAVKLYEQGREQTRARLKQFDVRLESGDEATKAKARINRRKITEYAQFPFDTAVESVLAGLDR